MEGEIGLGVGVLLLYESPVLFFFVFCFVFSVFRNT